MEQKFFSNMGKEELAEIASIVREILHQEKIGNLKERKIIATRDWFDKNYGESVMRELTKRRLIFPYAFGTKDAVDPEGNLVKKRKGAIYYRVLDVENIIEDYNLYKSLQGAYKQRKLDFKREIQKLQDNINDKTKLL